VIDELNDGTVTSRFERDDPGLLHALSHRQAEQAGKCSLLRLALDQEEAPLEQH